VAEGEAIVDGLRYATPDSSLVVELRKEPLVKICRLSLGAGDRETGGILVGSYSADGLVAAVSEASRAPPDSKSGDAYFERGTAGLREYLASRWDRDERTYYLGEWHYHTLNIPVPSEQDRRQMREISVDRDYRCDSPLLVITTPRSRRGIGISVFLFSSGSSQTELLQVGIVGREDQCECPRAGGTVDNRDEGAVARRAGSRFSGLGADTTPAPFPSAPNSPTIVDGGGIGTDGVVPDDAQGRDGPSGSRCGRLDVGRQGDRHPTEP